MGDAQTADKAVMVYAIAAFIRWIFQMNQSGGSQTASIDIL
jgi:hypothetical protein